MIFKTKNFILNSKYIFVLFFLLSASTTFALDPDSYAVPDETASASPSKNVLTLQKIDDRTTRILIDGAFFADYRSDYRGTPIVWPICAPNGALASRAWPMIADVDVENEPDAAMKTLYRNAQIAERGGSKDHPHHRSLWFDHGDVDGGDFWGLSDSKIRQTEVLATECDEKTAKIQTKNRWFNAKENRDVCEDVRTIVFGVLPGKKPVRYIDFSIEIVPLKDDVIFGDTKEGTFGYRLPSPTALTARKSNANWGGRILDNLGDKDDKTWGKRAAWVDYSGPAAQFLEGDVLTKELAKGDDATDFPLTTIGVAVFNAPSSWAFPSWRHVRDYGLFATNPFGQKEFEPYNADANGAKKLKRGEKLSFDYRVLIHNGDLTPDELNAAFEEYSSKF